MVADAGNEVTTRDRIGEVALSLFLVNGYVGTSMREISRAVGVTTPALYYHYESKDELLAALVADFAKAGDELIAHLTAFDSGSPEFTREACERYYDLLVEHLRVFRFVTTDRAVRGHPVAGQRLVAQANTFLRMLAGPEASHTRRVRAAASMGAIRRACRLPELDHAQDKATIIDAALAALGDL